MRKPESSGRRFLRDVRRHGLAQVVLLLAAGGFAIQAQGETWTLPLPEGANYRPLTSVPGWRLPGVFKTLEAASTGVRSATARASTADHALAADAGIIPGRGLMRLKVTLRCRRDHAIWVGVGRDDIDRNGELDWMECRLLVGLDRGRWGLRQNAMGETVWARAILLVEGSISTMEVVVDAERGVMRSVHVTDNAARRTPAAFEHFDPDWSAMSSADATDWQMFRIGMRGEGAELLGLSLTVFEPSLLLIK
ncbi:MAG: hypothetical protein ACOX9C_12875 [Kiritimatiellia bacterium]